MSDHEKNPRRPKMSPEELRAFLHEDDGKDPLESLREMMSEENYNLLMERIRISDEIQERLYPSTPKSNQGDPKPTATPAALKSAAVPPSPSGRGVGGEGEPVPKRGRPFAVPHPEIMTIEQCADYLQMHPQVIYRHVRQGTLPCVRIGGSVRVKKSVLDAFLEQDAWRSVGEFLAYLQNKRAGLPSTPGRSAESEGTASGVVQRKPRRNRFSADVD